MPSSVAGCPKTPKCKYCGRPAHETEYPRDLKARQKALLRDAKSKNSGLPKKARKTILDSNGTLVPEGYEVHHVKPLYRRKYKNRCLDDTPKNMKTIPRSQHRKLHRKCGKTYHRYKKRKWK